jgi:hypothetical protein
VHQLRPNTRVQRTRSSPSALREPLTRRPLGSGITASALAGLLWIGAPPAAIACSCVAPPPPLEAMAESRAVFGGKVIRVDDHFTLSKKIWVGIRYAVSDLFDTAEPDFSPRWYGKAVTLEADRVWKGLIGRSIVIMTAQGGGDCGVEFRVGESYLVYLRPYRKDWADTDLCSRTRRIGNAAGDLAALGVGAPPDPGVR